MKRKQVIFVVSVVVILIVSGGLASYIREQNSFDFTKCLSKQAYTIQGEAVLLKEVAYYIMVQEESVNETALTYDAKNPRAYWNLYISNRYVSSLARDTALDYCIWYQVHSIEAEKEGITLTGEEEDSAMLEGGEIYSGMTEKQAAVTKLSEEDLQNNAVLRALADKFVKKKAKEDKVYLTAQALKEEYGPESKYFEKLKKDYRIEINKKLIEKIPMGSVTIN